MSVAPLLIALAVIWGLGWLIGRALDRLIPVRRLRPREPKPEARI